MGEHNFPLPVHASVLLLFALALLFGPQIESSRLFFFPDDVVVAVFSRMAFPRIGVVWRRNTQTIPITLGLISPIPLAFPLLRAIENPFLFGALGFTAWKSN